MSPIFFGNNIASFIHVNAKMNNNNFALPYKQHKGAQKQMSMKTLGNIHVVYVC